MNGFSLLYLILMVALVVGILLLLRSAQKGALEELGRALGRGDVAAYLAMLQSRKLGLVLRKSTLALLRLEGHIRAGDAAAVAADRKTLEGMRLKPEERLTYLQKCLCFFLAWEEEDTAKDCLREMEKLLEKEPDEKLKATLETARQLVAQGGGHGKK